MERAGKGRTRSRVREIEPEQQEKPVEEVKLRDSLKINFGLEKERAEYIQKKLDDILENIGSSYGRKMAEELVRRLQKTITDFHAEVEGMLSRLTAIEDERQKVAETEPEKDVPDEFGNLSEVERRLEMKERRKTEEKPAPAEAQPNGRKPRRR